LNTTYLSLQHCIIQSICVKNLNSKNPKKFMSITISKAISVGLYQSEESQIWFAAWTSSVQCVHFAKTDKLYYFDKNISQVKLDWGGWFKGKSPLWRQSNKIWSDAESEVQSWILHLQTLTCQHWTLRWVVLPPLLCRFSNVTCVCVQM